MDGSVERLRDDVAPLADLSPRLGTFFCAGNHAYYSGVDGYWRPPIRLGAPTEITLLRLVRG